MSVEIRSTTIHIRQGRSATDPSNIAVVAMERSATVDENEVVLAQHAIGAMAVGKSSILCRTAQS